MLKTELENYSITSKILEPEAHKIKVGPPPKPNQNRDGDLHPLLWYWRLGWKEGKETESLSRIASPATRSESIFAPQMSESKM